MRWKDLPVGCIARNNGACNCTLRVTQQADGATCCEVLTFGDTCESVISSSFIVISDDAFYGTVDYLATELAK